MSVPTTTPVQDKLQIIHADPSYAVGTWGCNALTTWRQGVSVHGLAVLSRAMLQLQKGYPAQRFNLLVCMEPTYVLGTDSSSFDACVEALKRFEGSIAAHAVVYNREGFWNAAARARVTAVHSSSKTELPYAIHATVDAAIGWLLEHGSGDAIADPHALAQAMGQLRSAHG